MIKEVSKKIYFLPYGIKKGRTKDTSAAPTVSVSRKYNKIIFSKSAIKAMGMTDKFVRLYYEPTKKVIGWRMTTQLSEAELKSKVWRLCKPSPSTGVWVWSIKAMLDEMQLPEKTFTDLEVKKYREKSLTEAHAGEVFYFVEISNNKETT